MTGRRSPASMSPKRINVKLVGPVSRRANLVDVLAHAPLSAPSYHIAQEPGPVSHPGPGSVLLRYNGGVAKATVQLQDD